MLKLTKIGMKISEKECNGVTNPSLKYVRRRVGERWKNGGLWPSVKHGGGSVLVWGCISASGVGDIVWTDGIINAGMYRHVLIHHAIPSGKRLIGNVLFFNITIPSTLLMQWNHIRREKKLKKKKNTDSHGLASTESRSEYYRGNMWAPGQKKK